MKYCTHCKLSVTGHPARCPLCQNNLEGDGTFAPFPVLSSRPARVQKMFFRLVLFLSAAAAFLCVFMNLLVPQTGAWSVFAVAGIACLWVSLGIALHTRRSLLKSIAWQAAALSMLSILWDYFTHWRGWSVNFVVPCILLVTMLLTPALAHLLHLPRSGYLVYFGLVFVFGLAPAIFLVTGLVTVPLPSILSVCLSGVSLIGVVAFGGRAIVAELRRRFHL